MNEPPRKPQPDPRRKVRIDRNFGRRGTTSQKLVDVMLSGKFGDRPAQQVISLAMLESFRAALLRLRAPTAAIESATNALLDLTRNSPDRLDDYLLLDKGHAAFSMQDREDARVLAIAFAADADLLVTDNLADFATKDCVSIETSRARHARWVGTPTVLSVPPLTNRSKIGRRTSTRCRRSNGQRESCDLR